MSTKLHSFAFIQPSIGIRACILTDDTQRSGQELLQIACAGDVIGVAMSVKSELQLEAQLFDESCIASSLLQHYNEILKFP